KRASLTHTHTHTYTHTLTHTHTGTHRHTQTQTHTHTHTHTHTGRLFGHQIYGARAITSVNPDRKLVVHGVTLPGFTTDDTLMEAGSRQGSTNIIRPVKCTIIGRDNHMLPGSP